MRLNSAETRNIFEALNDSKYALRKQHVPYPLRMILAEISDILQSSYNAGEEIRIDLINNKYGETEDENFPKTVPVNKLSDFRIELSNLLSSTETEREYNLPMIPASALHNVIMDLNQELALSKIIDKCL